MSSDPSIEAPPYVVPHSKQRIPVLYHDEYLLIVDKPHLLLSVPGRHPVNRDSLIGRLAPHFPGVAAVHRLDLDTSGLLVVPRRRDSLSQLSREFQRRAVAKTYIAIVWGEVPGEQGVIDLPIARDWANRPRQKICRESGKPSITEWRVLHRSPGKTMLELKPITGRSHQLRIHLRELGHPILGCDMYAHESALRAAPRLLLHATRLGFHHPHTNEWLAAVSPVPFGLDTATGPIDTVPAYQ